MADSYDVIIVGAGMVGAAAACLLSKSDTTGKKKPLKRGLKLFYIINMASP